MSTADTLPEDIVFEILSQALHVPDTDFTTLLSFERAGGVTSPFLTFSQPRSTYLLVSKTWLNVATPVLYSTVVLRSKAQAQALAATLMIKPDLGQFIHRLRVEGGYGNSMHKILKSSQNITDIFLSLDLARSDDPRGLCSGLALISPIRVIVNSPDFVPPVAQGLFEVIKNCLLAWRRLTKLEMSLWFSIQGAMPRVLNKVPYLQSMVLWNKRDARLMPDSIKKIGQNPALTSIRIMTSSAIAIQIYRQMLFDAFEEDIRFMHILNLAETMPSPSQNHTSSVSATHTTTNFIYPAQLLAHPALEEAVWNHILSFAFQSDAPVKTSMVTMPPPRQADRSSRVSLLTVNKMFMRLGIPHLYRDVVLRYESNARMLASQLERNTGLGRHIRTLFFGFAGNTMHADFDKIVAHTPSLVELDAYTHQPIPLASFQRLGKIAGASLVLFRGLKVSDTSRSPLGGWIVKSDLEAGGVNPAPFSLFPRLRTLHWDSDQDFGTDVMLIPTTALGSLENLTVDNFHESFLKLISFMELPSLRTVAFNSHRACGGFSILEQHGAKLHQLSVSEFQMDGASIIWRACPLLNALHILCTEPRHPKPKSNMYSWDGLGWSDRHVDDDSEIEPRPANVPASWFTTSETHMHLERIVFVVAYTNQGSFTEPEIAPAKAMGFNDMIDTLQGTTSFPALRVIEHPQCEWPNSEDRIATNCWVKWAETLLPQHVHLQGSDGICWRPRLKLAGQPGNRYGQDFELAGSLLDPARLNRSSEYI